MQTFKFQSWMSVNDLLVRNELREFSEVFFLSNGSSVVFFFVLSVMENV